MDKVMTRPRTNGRSLPFSLLLLWASCVSAESSAEDVVPQQNPQEDLSDLQASKASLVYFQRDMSPSAEVFLEQLESSVEALRDYGISVLKVSCRRREASSYCREDNALEKAYLFRGRVLLRELPTDALFSVDAIVANVLFALLFNEVKYMTTLVDLQNLEDSLKGQADLVFAYVQAIGTAEHRVLMEAAFVYDSVKFALTTEVTLLRSIRSGEPEVPASKLFFCHCKAAVQLTQLCRRTLMEQPLTTLNVHKFLKLMGEPLVTEVAEDPATISTLHLQLGLPLIFILTQEGTLEAERTVAESVAWRLLGKAGVLLLSRNSVGRDVLPHCNVAIKKAEEGVPVKYLVLKDMDEIIALVESVEETEPVQELEEEEEEEEEDAENNEQEIQDDQVVESVVRDRKHELPLGDIRTLTGDSFDPALAEAKHTVVLFYASWEAVSLVVLQTYIEAAALLEGTPEFSFARVNCWDWPQLCTQQNVVQFPAIKMHTKGGRWLVYSGMWGTEELLRFLELSTTACPVRLTTTEEVEQYLSVKISPFHNVSVLGLFDSSMSEEKEAFIEAGRMLNGYVMTGIYYEEDATDLSHKYNVPLPALMLAKPETQRRNVIQLTNYSTGDIVEAIRLALLDSFPEITVGNLPEYFQLGKPLLVLFIDGALSKSDEGEMKRLAEAEHREAFVVCWLNLENTPVGRGVLKAYLGPSLPPLPLLLWISLHAGGQVFVFPSDQSISEANVLAWIEDLKAGREVPSATLSDEDWKPHLPAYDFLSMMAPPLPEFTIYSRGTVRAHPVATAEVPGERKAGTAVGQEPMNDSPMAEQEKEQPMGGDLRGTAPRLAAREKQAKRHSEL